MWVMQISDNQTEVSDKHPVDKHPVDKHPVDIMYCDIEIFEYI